MLQLKERYLIPIRPEGKGTDNMGMQEERHGIEAHIWSNRHEAI
jgi:hypothetical protein